MSVPHSSESFPDPGVNAPQASNPDSTDDGVVDQELKDWDAYYQLLQAGGLTEFGGQYVVVHQGQVIANGPDLSELRASAARRLGIPLHKIVVPFVDDSECIVTE